MNEFPEISSLCPIDKKFPQDCLEFSPFEYEAEIEKLKAELDVKGEFFPEKEDWLYNQTVGIEVVKIAQRKLSYKRLKILVCILEDLRAPIWLVKYGQVQMQIEAKLLTDLDENPSFNRWLPTHFRSITKAGQRDFQAIFGDLISGGIYPELYLNTDQAIQAAKKLGDRLRPKNSKGGAPNKQDVLAQHIRRVIGTQSTGMTVNEIQRAVEYDEAFQADFSKMPSVTTFRRALGRKK